MQTLLSWLLIFSFTTIQKELKGSHKSRIEMHLRDNQTRLEKLLCSSNVVESEALFEEAPARWWVPGENTRLISDEHVLDQNSGWLGGCLWSAWEAIDMSRNGQYLFNWIYTVDSTVFKQRRIGLESTAQWAMLTLSIDLLSWTLVELSPWHSLRFLKSLRLAALFFEISLKSLGVYQIGSVISQVYRVGKKCILSMSVDNPNRP